MANADFSAFRDDAVIRRGLQSWRDCLHYVRHPTDCHSELPKNLPASDSSLEA